MLDDFHFVRPLWLLFIPYALWLHTRLRRAYSATRQWEGAIEPALLAHLTVGAGRRRRLRPYQLMTPLVVLMSVIVAGPTWDRVVTPFTKDRAPLVIAIELTPSMLGADVQPSRLERARHKVRDLLLARRGARTAVIGYAGSAHMLLPFTDDTELIEVYLEALHPDLMPEPGDAPDRALSLAGQLLSAEEVAGTVLFASDGIDRSHADAFAAFAERTRDQVLLLAFGTDEGGEVDPAALSGSAYGDADLLSPPVDRVGLEAVASAASGSLVAASIGDDDLERLLRRIRTHLVDALSDDELLSWRERGYPLVWALAAIMLVWFRRGWTVQWQV
ncbi:MAG: VWA domain-containing protein [Myxococcota bacterium]|nr:VWA domain-containing protein [Myxococcota bacterium]